MERPAGDPASLFSVEGLSIAFPGVGEVVRDISFSIGRGETVGVVGESGSGKSMLARAAMRLLPPQASIVRGRMMFEGQSLFDLSHRDMRAVRGAGIGMVFQEPMTSLNPALTIGSQIKEGLQAHGRMNGRKDSRRILDMLERVRIKEPQACLLKYPHEFSGGMRQRIMLASVLLMKPRLLIADEPTTALDAVIQREVLEIMAEITRDLGVAVMLISHDLGVVGAYTERLVVMQKGNMVEQGRTRDILFRPQHPYTQTLIGSLPSREKSWSRSQSDAVAEKAPLLEVDNLRVVFTRKAGLPFAPAITTDALRGVSLTISPGETVAVVGESGSGKTTLGRAILRLVNKSGGAIRIAGRDVQDLSSEALRHLRRTAQIVFQDPYSSLDPRRRIHEIVAEGLRGDPDVPRRDYRARAAAVLDEVDLPASFLDRFPHQLSGGQRQRVCIARALIMRPSLVIADEPVSALDITVQARILELMKRLQHQHGFAYLFISHDLGVVEQIADRVIVMQAGRVVEEGARDAIFDNPQHPYTRLLLQAVPDLHEVEPGAYEIRRRYYDDEPIAPQGMRFDWQDAGGQATLIEIGDRHRVSCVPAAAGTHG
ncbi:ABC transporter ATP-binding protein [Chelatococcus asaccharovorans]|uniref:ABC transporter ATP-binding protein n=1 Tax=Chelatococcus asaccharovorans TaxID=28210 RepID=UPI00224C72F7|nr:ABC transporter ATP-binding protein [Chelatococcus asaccharovorans]CAH1658178.1 Glutathione import ATP-binding protein GsiA [Chelatococcus asaccharovorans]CAH1688807.1 Glutathione import ATP-binding protein GsiA [Chelatococcus asaccharovorans]